MQSLGLYCDYIVGFLLKFFNTILLKVSLVLTPLFHLSSAKSYSAFISGCDCSATVSRTV